MQDEANGIVQGLRFGEGLMATFVREHPEACHDEPLNDGENAPEQAECDCRLDPRSQDVAEKRPICRELEEVSGNISQAAASGTDKAVLGDGGPDLVDVDVWELELVAICIGQASLRHAGIFHGHCSSDGTLCGGNA